MFYQAVHQRLNSIARKQSTTSYSEIAPLAQLEMDNPHHRELMRQMLYEINRHEHGVGHPLLSAVVIYMDGNGPGRGFFTCAQELGLYKGRNDAEEEAFWVSELSRVYEFWVNH